MSSRLIHIRNDLAEIDRASGEVTAFLESQPGAGAVIPTVNLGLEEVVTNIIKYGYDDDRHHSIEITVAVTPAELRLVIVDDGREFDPLQHPKPDPTKPLDEREPGGLGVAFYRHLFDDVQYQRADGRNCLTMRKRLPEGTAN